MELNFFLFRFELKLNNLFTIEFDTLLLFFYFLGKVYFYF